MSDGPDATTVDESKADLLREAERLSAEREGGAASDGPGAVRSFLIVSHGDELYAVDLVHVRKVVRSEPVTPVPGASDEIVGLMNCHGEALCLLDLGRIVGTRCEPRDRAPGERLVVVLRHGGKEAGILVNAVDDVCELSHSAMLPPLESLEPSRARLFEGTVARGARFVGVLNVPLCLNP